MSDVVMCPYCERLAELVTGADVYPTRRDLAAKRFWRCTPCQAYVGCHPAGHGQGDGTKPLGRLANEELRLWKRRAHAAFDPLWKSKAMRRHEAYGWLASTLGINVAHCHIGLFDVITCERTVTACEERSWQK